MKQKAQRRKTETRIQLGLYDIWLMGKTMNVCNLIFCTQVRQASVFKAWDMHSWWPSLISCCNAAAMRTNPVSVLCDRTDYHQSWILSMSGPYTRATGSRTTCWNAAARELLYVIMSPLSFFICSPYLWCPLLHEILLFEKVQSLTLRRDTTACSCFIFPLCCKLLAKKQNKNGVGVK